MSNKDTNVKTTPRQKTRLNQARDHLITVLFEKGYTQKEIAFVFNITRQLVNNIIKKYNVK